MEGPVKRGSVFTWVALVGSVGLVAAGSGSVSFREAVDSPVALRRPLPVHRSKVPLSNLVHGAEEIQIQPGSMAASLGAYMVLPSLSCSW